MEYVPEIVVDELTFFFTYLFFLTWFIGRHYDEAIYNSDTYLRTSNKYVRGWDKGILHCSAVVQGFFFPKGRTGAQTLHFLQVDMFYTFLHNGKANSYALQYFNTGGRSPICL